MAENSVKELKDYFGTVDNPVSTTEMMDFWKSLTPDQKEYFKTAVLD